jgi:hypothetical protein
MFPQPGGGATVGSQGDDTMYKVLIGAGALLLATTAIPASANDWNGYAYSNGSGYGYGGSYNGYGNGYGGGGGYNSYGNGYGGNYYSHRNYGGGYYDIVRQHVRACQAHERLHEALGAAHDQAHDEGFDSSDEHSDVHEALGEAHEGYHENHPEVQHCDFWYSQYDRMNHRYYRSYGGSYGSYSNGY